MLPPVSSLSRSPPAKLDLSPPLVAHQDPCSTVQSPSLHPSSRWPSSDSPAKGLSLWPRGSPRQSCCARSLWMRLPKAQARSRGTFPCAAPISAPGVVPSASSLAQLSSSSSSSPPDRSGVTLAAKGALKLASHLGCHRQGGGRGCGVLSHHPMSASGRSTGIAPRKRSSFSTWALSSHSVLVGPCLGVSAPGWTSVVARAKAEDEDPWPGPFGASKSSRGGGEGEGEVEGAEEEREEGKEAEEELELSPVSRELQQLLVQQVRLQVGEVQVARVVDESAQRLRSSVRDGMGQELDRIATRAMRGADDFSNRVLKKLDASALALERDLLLARKEMEAREREFEKFQLRVYQANNEGLFFKGLYSNPQAPVSSRTNRGAGKMPAKGISAATSAAAGVVSPSTTAEAPANSSSALKGPPGRDDTGTEEAVTVLFKRVLYMGLALTCVSFLWSASTALLLDGHFMGPPKLVAYAAVFLGFVVINAGFEASTTSSAAACPPSAGVSAKKGERGTGASASQPRD